MSSIPGLPTLGSNVTFLITRVNLNPLFAPVELWGNFDQKRKLDYQHMRREIQFPNEIFHEFEGNPGDLCLVQPCETWYRARVVSRNGANYSVFLIDEGRTLNATNRTLAWGQKYFFHLPPEVEFCVLANVLPLSPENGWCPMALEFLKSLCGIPVNGCVQDVLVPHRAFLLDIPCISKPMCEMGFAKKLSIEKFNLFIATSLESRSGAVVMTDSEQISSIKNEPVKVHSQVEKWQCYMYPELQAETVETVIVTEVTNPLRIFCQLKVFSQELKKLTEQITQHFEGRLSTKKARPERLGSPCASRGSDGRWYRSLLQQVLPSNNTVEVLHVDYGKKDVVELENVRPLAAEFLRMPVVTYVCSLHGVSDKGVGWTAAQIDYLKSLLLGRTVVAMFEYQSLSEGVHYVTLFEHDNVNINDLFGKAEKCLLDPEKSCEVVSHKRQDAVGNKMWISPGPHNVTGKCSDMEKIKTCGAQALFTDIPTVTETKSVFKEHLFPIGSSVDVNVSYIESPNDFWCQIAQNERSLDSLMEVIQHYYADREFQQPVEAACVARHPDTQMWYRALIIQKHTTPHVDVLFIDYGKTEKVSIQDLRPIKPTFLKLEGQAFRCCLYNLIHPAGHSILEWSDAATSQFEDFLDTAASTHVDLKCTICAVMYDLQKVVYSVDLETPFQSVSSLLVQKGLADRAPPERVPLPPFRLDAFYYSTHDIKTGGEEEVFITNVRSINLFYCQLGRNSDLVEELAEEVNCLCRQLQRISSPHIVDTVCFAKYTDGQWYRGQIKSTHPVIEVQFVDYGDTLEVDKSDLLPIPINASKILSVPVQAVECGLSDVPTDVSSDVNRWFANNATNQSFKALVVAKEPCGKLMVELYDGKIQVNSKTKERVRIEAEKKENVSYERCDARSQYRKDSSVKHTKKYKTSDEHKPKLAPQRFNEKTEKHKTFQNRDTSFRQKELWWKVGKSQNLEEHKIPLSDSEHEEAPTRKAQDAHGGDSYAVPKGKEQTFPKLEDLPSKSIKPGLSLEVFVSHCISPSSFFVQFANEENEIFSVVEKLNEDPSAVTPVDINALQQGDLVNAEFEDDCSWYRAVVRDKMGNHTVHVEFIDFGNTATISSSKICRLDEQFFELPRYSIHCLLNGVSSVYKDKWDKDLVTTFQRAVGENAEKKLKCNFIKQTGSVWEVSLADQNVMLADVLFDSGPAVALDGFMSKNLQSPKLGNTVPEKSRNKSEMDLITLVYKTPCISEGQTFEMYATSIVGPDYFWCQCAHSDKLQKISELVGEMGNSAVQKATWVDDLCPGSPCLALSKEDEQWYRAEVITKMENDFSILFVDYGNESKVEQNTVKPVPPLLLETPPQASLCQLEGFDPSKGSWVESAADKFFGLIMDEVLRVTIVKIQNKNRKTPQYRVRVVCKEQVINYTMKDYWKHFTSLVDTALPKNEAQPSTEIAVSFEITSLETHELISAGQNISKDLYPEKNLENTIYSPSDVTQSFGSQNKESKLLNSGESIEIPEQQPDLPVNILPVEKTGIKDEDLEFTSELTSGFDKSHESAISTVDDQGKGEGREIPRGQNEIKETQVVTEDPTENTLSPSRDSDDSFNLVCVADSTSEITYPIGNSKDMLSCTLEVLEESITFVSEVTDIAELAAASSEDLPGVNSVCLTMSEQEDCETEMCTSESFKALEETDKNTTPFDGSCTSIEVQACMLDETDPLFYKVDESFDGLLVLHEDQCPDAHIDSDIYEEVFEQCPGPNLQDVRPVSLFSDEMFRKENAEGDHVSRPEYEFGKLELAERKLCVGSDCVVWSYAHSRWCRGRIVKISEDCVKVLLLEYNAETIMDLQDIFERCPETPVQDPVADIFSSNSGSQPVQDNNPEERPGCEAVLSPATDSEEMAQGEILKAAASATDVESCDQDNGIDEKTEDGVDISPVSASEEMVQGETQASTGNVFEEQMSLSLTVEELSDDEVIFVMKTQIPRQQVQELGANEKEQPKDLN